MVRSVLQKINPVGHCRECFKYSSSGVEKQHKGFLAIKIRDGNGLKVNKMLNDV